MAVLHFACPFCKKEEHEYQGLAPEPGRRVVTHECGDVPKRSYVFVDRHTDIGEPIYLRCVPPAS